MQSFKSDTVAHACNPSAPQTEASECMYVCMYAYLGVLTEYMNV